MSGRTWLVFSVTMTLAFQIVGYSPYSFSADPIVIGISIPLSGPSGASGEQMRDGFALKAKEINDAGGINGSPIKLMIEDDGGNPTTGVSLVDKFASAKAVAIMGTYNSPVALAMSARIKEIATPHLMVAVSAAISDNKNPFQYQSMSNDREQMRGVALFLKKRGLTRPAIMTDTTALGTSALPVLRKTLADAGLKVAAEETFEVSASDITPQLLRIKAKNADSIVAWTIAGTYGQLMVGMNQVSYRVPVFGNAATSDPAVARVGGVAADELYYQDVYQPSKPAAVAVNNKWKQMYPGKGDINFISVLAYDLLTIVSDGLKKVGPDSKKLKGFLDTYKSSALATGAPGSSWTYTETDHRGLKAEDTIWRVYKKGKVQLFVQDK